MSGELEGTGIHMECKKVTLAGDGDKALLDLVGRISCCQNVDLGDKTLLAKSMSGSFLKRLNQIYYNLYIYIKP